MAWPFHRNGYATNNISMKTLFLRGRGASKRRRSTTGCIKFDSLLDGFRECGAMAVRFMDGKRQAGPRGDPLE
jgi:hypothetical protein